MLHRSKGRIWNGRDRRRCLRKIEKGSDEKLEQAHGMNTHGARENVGKKLDIVAVKGESKARLEELLKFAPDREDHWDGEPNTIEYRHPTF